MTVKQGSSFRRFGFHHCKIQIEREVLSRNEKQMTDRTCLCLHAEYKITQCTCVAQVHVAR